MTNFARTLPAPQSDLAQELIKDPYSFDFLAVGSAMSEHELEQSLPEHLRSLIFELGKGFAFVGSQHHLEVRGQDYYLDLLFYHLRLRCFVVVELMIEELKPEFARKMNFYLSAVDDQLRHETDAPIGIILCKGKSEVIVECALRDSTKPMGVAEYTLSAALPELLQAELPTEAEFASEFPLMSLAKLRIEIEREIRLLLNDQIDGELPLALGSMRVELRQLGIAPQVTDQLRSALHAMNEAVHGVDVDPTEAYRANEVATAFLADFGRFAMDNAHTVQPELLNLDVNFAPSVSDEVALNLIEPALANRLLRKHLIDHRSLSMSCRASSSE